MYFLKQWVAHRIISVWRHASHLSMLCLDAGFLLSLVLLTGKIGADTNLFLQRRGVSGATGRHS